MATGPRVGRLGGRGSISGAAAVQAVLDGQGRRNSAAWRLVPAGARLARPTASRHISRRGRTSPRFRASWRAHEGARSGGAGRIQVGGRWGTMRSGAPRCRFQQASPPIPPAPGAVYVITPPGSSPLGRRFHRNLAALIATTGRFFHVGGASARKGRFLVGHRYCSPSSG